MPSMNSSEECMFFVFLIIIYLLTYFWLRWVFVAAQTTLQLRCVAFSRRWLLLLGSTGSRASVLSSFGSQALEHRLNSCGAQLSFLEDVGSSRIRDRTHASCIGRPILYH